MDVQVEEKGSYQREIKITLPVETVENVFSSVYRDFSKKAQVPGFRPGKVPKKLIEQQFGSRLSHEVREKLVDTTLFKALAEKKLAPVAMPHIHPGELEKGSEFTYTAHFDVQPEVELKSYKQLSISLPKTKDVTEQVDQELEKLQKQSAQLVPLMIRDVVEDGDTLVMDYEGTMGGMPFDGGAAQNALIEIGQDHYLPEFSATLRGCKVPSTQTIHLTFPADYAAKDLSGKDATFKVELKELKTKELPELNDDFAKDLGEETLTALKAKILEGLEQRSEEEYKNTRRRRILEAMVEANAFDVPESMVKSRAGELTQSATMRAKQMFGPDFELPAAELESLSKDNEEEARFQVQAGLLLDTIAQKEDIQPDDEAVHVEIEKMAANAGEHAEQLKVFYNKPENRQQLEFRVLEDKTLNFLLENAEVSEDKEEDS